MERVATPYAFELWDLSSGKRLRSLGVLPFSEGFEVAAALAREHDEREPLSWVMQGPFGDASRLVLSLRQLHQHNRRHGSH